MKVYIETLFPEFNCPECGIGLALKTVHVNYTGKLICPECGTKLHLTQRVKYIVRIV